MKLDNETIVIALLSGYVSELKEGKDYLETTLKTAKQIVKTCSTKRLKKYICPSCKKTHFKTKFGELGEYCSDYCLQHK